VARRLSEMVLVVAERPPPAPPAGLHGDTLCGIT
jgi:hypothetical protein